MKTSLKDIIAGATFSVATVFLGLVSAEPAYAPNRIIDPPAAASSYFVPAPKPSRVKGLDKVLADLQKYETTQRKLQAAASERKEKFDSDGIYREVNQVYNSVKETFDIPPYLTPEFFRAIIHTESSDNPHAVSQAGAKGYTQMTPAAAKEVGVKDFDKVAFNTWDNINISMAYFAWLNRTLSKSYPGWDKLSDIEKARDVASAYNMGYGAFLGKCFGVDGKFTTQDFPQETKDYWPKIMRAWAKEFPNTFANYVEKHSSYSSDILKEYLPKNQKEISDSKGLIASK